jgi:hypothetical protein
MRYEDCPGGIEAKGSANVKSVIGALRCDQRPTRIGALDWPVKKFNEAATSFPVFCLRFPFPQTCERHPTLHAL